MSWVSPSSCIWADDTTWILGKTNVASQYTEFRDFCQRILGISTSDLAMHVRALEHKALANDVKPEELKDLMIVIGALGPSRENLESLSKVCIFPVLLRNRHTTIVNRDADFIIVYKPEYYEDFKDEIDTLHLTPMNVRKCMPFFTAMGLAGKHLSEAVREETMVEDGNLDRDLTAAFRSKAYAFVR